MAKQVYLQGKAKWARLSHPDPWGNFKITLYLNNESVEKFRALGVKNVLKKDEDGYHVVLRRPQQKMMRGKVVGLAPPTLVDKDGMPMRDIIIGNGSDVTVKLDLYEYYPPGSKEKEKAMRMSGVRVDNLVPYTPAHRDEFDAYNTKGLDEQPDQEEGW